MSDDNREIPENTLDLIKAIDMGDSSAVESLYRLVFDELHARARELFRHQPSDHTLQPTAVVNDAFAAMVGSKGAEFESRRHFVNAAAKAMRCILVDHARARAAAKRGGDLEKVTLSGVSELLPSSRVDVLALEEALGELEKTDVRRARVVELRFYGGLTAREIAEVLDVSRKTAEADWYFARAWLRRALEKLGD